MLLAGMIPSEASAAANSSFAFVYLLGVPVLGERLDAFKGVSVVVCLVGVALLAVAGAEGEQMHLSAGMLVETGCAVLQAVYLVLYRRCVVKPSVYISRVQQSIPAVIIMN